MSFGVMSRCLGSVWLLAGVGWVVSIGAPLRALVTVPLPQAVLAATIIVNLKGMLKQFSDTCSLWKTNRVDLVRGLGAQGCDRGVSAHGPTRPVDHCPSVFSSSGW